MLGKFSTLLASPISESEAAPSSASCPLKLPATSPKRRLIPPIAALSLRGPRAGPAESGPRRAGPRKPEVAHPSADVAGDTQEWVTLTAAEGASLVVTTAGRLVLYDGTAGTGRLVASASLHLPRSCQGLQPTVVSQDIVEGSLARAVLRWGPAAAPQAELRAVAATRADDAQPWHTGLSHGFLLDFRVSSAAASRAEVAVDLEPSGHWFGGGHFIRQVWPLNAAALEVGPWYGFDNGPNGVNTLLGPHWMTSNGLLVVVDDSTPFLHIGMNAPLAKDGGCEGWMPRKWGVGIQNAARELLPLSLDHRRVARAGSDGMLRVQGRATYAGAAVDHPLRDWDMLRCSRGSMSSGDEEAEEAQRGWCLWPRAPAAAAAAGGMVAVRVALCAAPNAAEAAKMALRTMTPPGMIPSIDCLRAPIWTTWARYKTRVTQDKVLRYAREICGRGVARSVMEIDDRWQVAYGDLAFDTAKFPDAEGMVAALHAMGFKVTCWVHPFVEERSEAFREGAALGYFVGSAPGVPALRRIGGGLRQWLQARLLGGAAAEATSAEGEDEDEDEDGGGCSTEWAPAFFPWWNPPPVVALDVTNPAAVAWFVGRLKALQAATGLDGFKFDAGEPCFLPPRPRTHVGLATPGDYTRLYVQHVAGAFAGGVSEVRTGHSTQGTAVMCRMGDRFSTWDAANGLRSLIPTLLTSGLLGYPFCLPDMIGGNAYFGQRPDAELLVRWAQANALMPAMQFSIAPWDLGGEAERLVAAALKLRSRLEGVLLSLAGEAAASLTPICRPLWMLAPLDEETYEIHDQFALGGDVIVAPVVSRGARQRDVYLTEGRWRSLQAPGDVVEGGRWLRGLPAPLDTLPVFVRDGAPGIVIV